MADYGPCEVCQPTNSASAAPPPREPCRNNSQIKSRGFVAETTAGYISSEPSLAKLLINTGEEQSSNILRQASIPIVEMLRCCYTGGHRECCRYINMFSKKEYNRYLTSAQRPDNCLSSDFGKFHVEVPALFFRNFAGVSWGPTCELKKKKKR